MYQRPLRNLSRSLLAACAISLTSLSLSAQTAPASTSNGVNPSRVDVFTGFSYLGAHGQVKPQGVPFSSVDLGVIGSGAYYFNKYVGAEGVFIDNPDGVNDGFVGMYGGPIFRAPMQNFTLFAHGLAGAVRSVGPNNDEAGPTNYYFEPAKWGPSLMVGGGMDYDLPWYHHRFGIRLFEADYRYIHEDFGPANTIPSPGAYLGGRANLSAAELSSGILMHFGSIVPPPPVTYSCAVTAPTGTVYPGDPVTITGTAANLDPKKQAAYTWSADSGKVSGTSNVAAVDTTGLAPGTYNVKGHISEGNKPGQMADCSVPLTVTAALPPTVTCSANPSTVKPGDSATITASGSSPQNYPLTYSYSATSGAVSGNTSTATLSTSGAAPGTITVTCNVVDSKGLSASQQTTVTVEAPPPPPAPTTQALCSVTFDRDKKRPTRVDNEAKACLDDIALTAQRQADAKLAISGTSEPVKVMGKSTPKKEEKATAEAAKMAAERAVNTKAYLVDEKGIDASRIAVYTGTGTSNTAATTLIPAGATLDTTGITPVDESAVKAIPRTAPAKKHKK